jgi:predicted RNA-binding Zn ribbon-like protein
MDRPLIGEPLPLDLLNTLWVEDGRTVDALADPAGVAAWLDERDLRSPCSAEQLGPVLREGREAIRQALLAPDQPAAHDALNALLARGHLRDRIGADGPESVVQVDEERWRIAWLAAHDLVALLRHRPQRIRRCAEENCILWFLDASRNGTRRWCTMDGCGNRSKVRRHRARHAKPAVEPPSEGNELAGDGAGVTPAHIPARDDQQKCLASRTGARGA